MAFVPDKRGGGDCRTGVNLVPDVGRRDTFVGVRGAKHAVTAQLLQARGAELVGAGCHSVTKSLFFSENARILPPDLPSNLALSASFCDFGAHFCFVGVR